ncbi:protein FAM24A-like [Sorex araneus]|uniref:protein FAM24A-like n=1 Tax=Sorex araneus TaxID=42254 RepID=UPI002433B0D9|nr:protein FAM24A-like [Sorex araneus]
MLDFKIMIAIGGGLLVALFVLLIVVICLYCKVARALSSPKVSKDMILTTGCYPAAAATIPACDECNIYADMDPLLPCVCDTNEGL